MQTGQSLAGIAVAWLLVIVLLLGATSAVARGNPPTDSRGTAAAFGAGSVALLTPPAINPIEHVVVIMLENHSFDNLFGQFPGANGVALPHATDGMIFDPDHSGAATLTAIHGGKMDEFQSIGTVQYSGVDLPNYWAYATHYGLADN